MQTSPSHPRGTVAQIVLAIVGIVLYGLAGAIFLIGTFTQGTDTATTLTDQISSLSLSLTAFTACALMIPSLVHATRPAQPAPVAKLDRSLLLAAALGMVIWGGLVFWGDWSIRNSVLPWLLPVLQVLATGIPLWFLFTLGSMGLSSGSAQRKWGILDFSLSVSPLAILVLEFFLLIVLGIILVIAVLLQPGALDNLQSFNRMMQDLSSNPTLIDPLITQLGQSPGVLAGVLIVVAVAIPFIEEILKPLGLIVLAKRKPTPSQGFVAGLLCGAGFAFLETAGNLAGAVPADWTSLAITRLGTGLLHITASGLVGWGLASAITLKKRGRFWGAYLSAVALHGTWNAFAILMGFFPILTPDIMPDLQFAAGLGTIAPYVLITLSVGMLVILVLMNRKLRREATTPPALPPPPNASAENLGKVR